MKELVEIIAKELVDKPEGVVVNENIDEDGTINISLKVEKDELGKVIGKKGRIAKSIRTIVKSVAISKNLKVNIDIVE